jgi:hypothetical protein
VKITAHQFRHTVGTRMINNEVSLDVVQRMLDHDSPEMTARYATIKDQTLRREWERFQQRINIQGELIPLPKAAEMSDAAWALENLARAKRDAAQRLLRPAAAADLPAPQRLPDLRQLPHHDGVPARPPRPAHPHRAAHRPGAGGRSSAAGRDERAGPAEPDPHHRRT